jgi:hypothetical protein
MPTPIRRITAAQFGLLAQPAQADAQDRCGPCSSHLGAPGRLAQAAVSSSRPSSTQLAVAQERHDDLGTVVG